MIKLNSIEVREGWKNYYMFGFLAFATIIAICFIIPLTLGPQKLKILALLDSGASTCFLDEEFAKRHKIHLVQKSEPVHVEVIDGRPLLSGSVIHEPEPIEVAFKDHSSYVVFNIIRTPSSPIILGFSWLEDHNPSIDWRLRRITFPIENNPIRKKQMNKPLFIEARAFIKLSKEGTPFVIYATSTNREKTSTASIPEQYKDFQDVF